ncbi:MAG: septation ring formation regulator EzrA [bacterium]|nr:septation ring formation regulator EzrA [bacterium]
MSRTTFILLGVTYYIISVIIIILVLNKINKREKKKYQDEILDLEVDKNQIISADIMSELQKVEELVNNALMQEIYGNLKKRFDEIKKNDIPEITDKLLELQELYDNKKYKDLQKSISDVELKVYLVKAKSDYLLGEIKQITLSKGKNREIATALKTRYRMVLTEYNNSKNDYSYIAKPVELQFENIDKMFSAFETNMAKNNYGEVKKIIRSLENMIGNLELVIKEGPSIILMANKLIPRKVEDIKSIKDSMIRDGYNLDYLNIDDAITDANKASKLALEKINVLNITDSSVELKTILDYFDNLYNEFDKEKTAKNLFMDYLRSVLVKANKLEKANSDLKRKTADYKYSYDIKTDDLKVLDEIAKSIKNVKKDYEILTNAYRNKQVAFTKLLKEMQKLDSTLENLTSSLNEAYSKFGNLKEDEIQAKEQLEEIREVLVKAKNKLNQYNLPIIPDFYYTYLQEAYLAIDNVKKELNKKPISIETLNIRVDTARDLALKLYNSAKEIIKSAYMAETSIVYGNRYRSLNNGLDVALIRAENLFFKGEYKKSLECSINAIDEIEPDFYQNLRSTVINTENQNS